MKHQWLSTSLPFLPGTCLSLTQALRYLTLASSDFPLFSPHSPAGPQFPFMFFHLSPLLFHCLPSLPPSLPFSCKTCHSRDINQLSSRWDKIPNTTTQFQRSESVRAWLVGLKPQWYGGRAWLRTATHLKAGRKQSMEGEAGDNTPSMSHTSDHLQSDTTQHIQL